MKNTILLLGILFLITSCGNKNNNADAYGNFEAIERIISSEVNGTIQTMSVEEGDLLNQSTMLAFIDTTTLALTKLQTVAQLSTISTRKATIYSEIEILKQQAQNQGKDQKRIHNLFKTGSATAKQKDDIDGALAITHKKMLSLKTQIANINQEATVLEAQIRQIDHQLEKCKIKAPYKGTILEKYAEEGELARTGTPMLKMADLSHLILRVYVSGAQLPHIKLGQKITVEIDLDSKNNQQLPGTITWISPEAEFTPKMIQTKEERVKLVYAVKVKVPNDGRLKIGMPGEVLFEIL